MACWIKCRFLGLGPEVLFWEVWVGFGRLYLQHASLVVLVQVVCDQTGWSTVAPKSAMFP